MKVVPAFPQIGEMMSQKGALEPWSLIPTLNSQDLKKKLSTGPPPPPFETPHVEGFGRTLRPQRALLGGSSGGLMGGLPWAVALPRHSPGLGRGVACHMLWQ
jgi:hypothetical protein